MYILNEQTVYKRDIDAKGAINDVYAGPFRKPEFLVSKKTISVGETLIVSFSWVKFDLNTGDYIPDTQYESDYIIDISTEEGDCLSSAIVPFGEAFEFALDTPGVYSLYAYSAGAGGNALKVRVLPLIDADSPSVTQDKLSRLQYQTLIILDALADLLAEYPLPEARKTEVDIYAELIGAGRRELKDVPEALKEAVGKEIGGEVIDKK